MLHKTSTKIEQSLQEVESTTHAVELPEQSLAEVAAKLQQGG